MWLTRRVRSMSMFAVAALVAGCASHGPATRPPSETGPSAPSAVVSAKELARFVRQGSLMDALEQLRPYWLGARGAPPLVSVDGSAPTDLSSLRLIPVSTVHEVRLQRASSGGGRSAILPNGDVVAGDMIVVSTRRGGGGDR